MKIDIDGISNAIVEGLKTYTSEIEKELKEEKERIGKEAATTLKGTSPRRSGRYAASWGTEKDDESIVIRNKKHYQRTHLLEKGHAKRGGGRVAGRTHIAPVEEKAVKEFEEVAEKVIQG